MATVTKNIRKRSVEEEQAEPAFRLGNFFREKGHADKADQYWELARTLHPDSVNYVRQDLTLSEEGSAGESYMKLRGEFTEQGKDYYRPLDMEET